MFFTRIMMSLRNTESEVIIKAPWGNVGALTWGNSKNPPVLLGSGRQVPCSTFRALVLKLPQDFFYISFDFPGNGSSDHLPKGVRFTVFDLIPSLLLVSDHFKCDTFRYVGHSLGSIVGKFFNMAYPGRMSRVVEIDPIPAYLSMLPGEMDEWYNEIYSSHYEACAYRKHTNCDTAPTYSCDEVRKLLAKAQYINVTENTDFLKDKYVKKDENGFYRFSHDQRMKSSFRLPFSPEYLKQLYTQSKIPTLAIFADSSIEYSTFRRSAFALNENEWPNRNYKVNIIKGDHNSHIHEPECMAENISKFLLSWDKRTKQLVPTNFPPEYYYEIFSAVIPPTLYIHANQSRNFNTEGKEIVDKLVKKMEENNQNFKVLRVDGTHDVHFINPTCFSDVLTAFLNNSDVISKL